MYEDLRTVRLELGELRTQMASQVPVPPPPPQPQTVGTTSPVPVRNRLPVLNVPSSRRDAPKTSPPAPAREGPAVLQLSPQETVYDEPEGVEERDLGEARVTVGRSQFDLLLAHFDMGRTSDC